MVTPEQQSIRYEFGPFCLDLAEHSLRRDGQPVPLPPKVFELLVILVERHGRTLEKERLMETLWPDVFVEESSLTQLVFQLRKTLGESAARQQYIETVPRRGYRFVAEVRVARKGEGEMVLTSRTGTRLLIEEEEEDHAPEAAPRDLNDDSSITSWRKRTSRRACFIKCPCSAAQREK